MELETHVADPRNSANRGKVKDWSATGRLDRTSTRIRRVVQCSHNFEKAEIENPETDVVATESPNEEQWKLETAKEEKSIMNNGRQTEAALLSE